MIFTWEEDDIVVGLNIVQPTKGVTAVIAWMGSSHDRGNTIVETNTDGRIAFQHRKDVNGELVTYDGELIEELFTRAELAAYLNSGEHRHQYVPLDMFTGTGNRLKYDKKGSWRECMLGLKDL